MALTKITAAIIEDGAITASALSDNSIGITQLNVSDGTSGQFLKTDGSGNLSFASVPAGYTDSDVDTKLAAGVGNILTTGYIAGPATFTIDPAAVGDNTGTVVIAGNLQVDGTTTTINSTTMTVDDLNITLASGAANAAAANGAGITVDGASATITYDGTNDEWDFNKNINVTGTGQATRLGLGVAPHATAGLNITNTNQHIRLNNGSELGIIHVLSTGELELWGHGDGESINFRTGSGAGTVAMNVVGNNVGIGITSNLNANLHVGSSNATGDATNPAIQIGGSSTGNTYRLGLYTSAEGGVIENKNGDDGLQFRVKTAGEAMIIDTSGDVQLRGGNQMTNALAWYNSIGPYELASIENISHPSYNDSGGLLFKTAGLSNSGMAERMRIDSSGNVGIGTSSPKSSLQIEGGRMGIISTSSSWEQLRVANSSVAEAGIAIMNGCTASEFLADDSPSFSNAFTLAINPYGCGTDTLAVAHGNLGDSIWHIDGSGNFGYGPGTENPASYYEISKTRPNVNQPSDYELKMTLNTYGYVGSGYKLALLQWLGGDTAGAQDNFYAGIGSTALDGVNNSEEGSLDFHVRNGISTTETLAMQIIGKAGTGIAGGGQHGKSVMFPYQGIAIDRVWQGYPGISVFNSSDAGTTQSEFRFHGTNSSSAVYPGTSGSDFSVDVRADGSFISSSDGRSKTNITTIDNALSKVNQLTGKRFQRINRENQPQEHLSKNGYKFGFIAQDVEDIIPEAVKYHADEDDGTENWNSAYAMDYGSVVALLVNAIKEQDVVIQDLKSRIETLEG